MKKRITIFLKGLLVIGCLGQVGMAQVKKFDTPDSMQDWNIPNVHRVDLTTMMQNGATYTLNTLTESQLKTGVFLDNRSGTVEHFVLNLLPGSGVLQGFLRIVGRAVDVSLITPNDCTVDGRSSVFSFFNVHQGTLRSQTGNIQVYGGVRSDNLLQLEALGGTSKIVIGGPQLLQKSATSRASSGRSSHNRFTFYTSDGSFLAAAGLNFVCPRGVVQCRYGTIFSSGGGLTFNGGNFINTAGIVCVRGYMQLTGIRARNERGEDSQGIFHLGEAYYYDDGGYCEMKSEEFTTENATMIVDGTLTTRLTEGLVNFGGRVFATYLQEDGAPMKLTPITRYGYSRLKKENLKKDAEEKSGLIECNGISALVAAEVERKVQQALGKSYVSPDEYLQYLREFAEAQALWREKQAIDEARVMHEQMKVVAMLAETLKIPAGVVGPDEMQSPPFSPVSGSPRSHGGDDEATAASAPRAPAALQELWARLRAVQQSADISVNS